MSENSWIHRAAWWLLGLWMFSAALFFFVRFSFEFYRANQEAIHAFFN